MLFLAIHSEHNKTIINLWFVELDPTDSKPKSIRPSNLTNLHTLEKTFKVVNMTCEARIVLLELWLLNLVNFRTCEGLIED